MSSDDFIRQADCLYDRKTIDAALDDMAVAITQKLADKNPLVLCILHGGLIFSGHLLTRLPFRLQQDYIHATRYRGKQSGDQLHWQASPHESLERRVILLLDDIFDQGNTLQAIRDYCFAEGAEEVYSAVLLKKNHQRPTKAMVPDFIGLEVEDRYVFGFGMDYEHYWRNANGIYALPEEKKT